LIAIRKVNGRPAFLRNPPAEACRMDYSSRSSREAAYMIVYPDSFEESDLTFFFHFPRGGKVYIKGTTKNPQRYATLR
jgi:hypothetical protein